MWNPVVLDSWSGLHVDKCPKLYCDFRVCLDSFKISRI